MIRIEKRKNNVTETYDILFYQDNKIFRISYEGNLDIYWLIKGSKYDYIDDIYGYYEFFITKENYPIYAAFQDLYQKIINAQLFDRNIMDNCKSFKEYEKEIKRVEEWQKEELKTDVYKDLVSSNVITWLSDDAILDDDDLREKIFV